MEIRWRVRGLQLETLGFQLVVHPLCATEVEGEKKFCPGIFRPTLGFQDTCPLRTADGAFAHTGRFLLGRWSPRLGACQFFFSLLCKLYLLFR